MRDAAVARGCWHPRSRMRGVCARVRGCAARLPRRAAAPQGHSALRPGAAARRARRGACTQYARSDAHTHAGANLFFRAAWRAGTLSVKEMQKIIRRGNGQFHKMKEISTLVDAIDLDGDGEARTHTARRASGTAAAEGHIFLSATRSVLTRAFFSLFLSLSLFFKVDFFEFVHFFAHAGDDEEEAAAPEPVGELHPFVACDICCGDVRGTRYISTKRSNILEGGHLSTYDVCMACKGTPAAAFGEPYVGLEKPDDGFTPWPKSACSCEDCRPPAKAAAPAAPAAPAAAADAPAAAAAPVAVAPATETKAQVMPHKRTGVTLAPTAVGTGPRPGGPPPQAEGGCCIIS